MKKISLKWSDENKEGRGERFEERGTSGKNR
jgi:hypothetical protein